MMRLHTSEGNSAASPTNNMKNEFPSLITSDPQAGLTLARQLADGLRREIERAKVHVVRPGGANDLLPAAVPKEITADILFYAIAGTNRGWTSKA